MQRKFKANVIGVIILVCIFGGIIYFTQSIKSQFRKLETEGVLDTAIVVREFTGAKRKLYFEYVFYVNSKKCNGFLRYSPSHGSISIGDSFAVKYLREDPDNINKLLSNEDRTLIVVTKRN